MKRTKKLLVLLISVIAMMAMLAVAVSAACNDFYFDMYGETLNVGDKVYAVESKYLQDMSNSVYGVRNTYRYSCPEDSGVVRSGDYLEFTKPGTVTITVKHGMHYERTGQSGTHTHTVTYTVKEPTAIYPTTIKLDSGAFNGGKVFPAFTTASGANYTVEEATFYKEMVDYYVGDTLPSYRAGTTISNVVVTLKPKSGYFFAWGGSNDGKSHESNVYTVEYKGKTYKPYVTHDKVNNEMTVYLDVTYEKGEIYATTFSNLDAPYHNGPLDKTVTVNSDVEFVNVQYTMFNKEFDVFEKGDNMAIAVRVKSKNPNNTFNKDGYAYWADRGVKSDKTLIISPTEAIYVFYYTVEALDSQTVKFVKFQMPGVYADGSLPTTVLEVTPGVKVKSVTWTPNDAVVQANKEYTVKIEFDIEDDYVFASDFEDQAVLTINGKTAKLIVEKSGSGRFTTEKYYAEAAFHPEIVLDTDDPDSTMTETQNFKIVPVGSTEVQLYEAGKAFTLKVKVTDNGEINADIHWYRCDANGKTLSAYPDRLSMDESLTVDGGIPAAEMLETRYYRADACIGNTVKSVIFTVTLCPIGVEEEYVFPFTDVKTTDWYYSFVEASHQMGLLNGTSDTTYAPNTDLTVAAAVKLAACMNILYNGGDPNTDISVGKGVWYSTYMAYALQHGIIDTDLSSRQGEKITRSEYVYMFSRALPAEAFKEINTVAVGSIPDVKSCNTKYEQAIYKFYRAGIVIGNSAGEFMPDNTISRAEVATILVRMMDTSFRVKK